MLRRHASAADRLTEYDAAGEAVCGGTASGRALRADSARGRDPSPMWKDQEA